MANTSIRIKRSVGTATPGTLAAGELAYSYASNVIFIGDSTGTGVINIGGQYYTSQIDNATDASTGSALVRRDASGNASFNYVFANIVGTIVGNANSATQLQTARDFSINGDDVDSSVVSFNGTGNVVLQGNLKTTGVSAGTYGGQTQIPVFTVDSKGRISSAANVSVATTLTFAGDTGGPNTVDLLTQTLTIAGGAGLTSTSSGQTVTLDVDNTVVRSNTAIQIQTIDGDIEISGNLTVLGNTTTVNVSTLSVEDSLIALARNNVTDAVDIGFYGHYDDGTARHAGIFRHAGDKQFYVFDNYDQEPTANTINPADSSFRLATLHTNLTANTANIQDKLVISSGSLFYANGTSQFNNGIATFNGGIVSDNTLVIKNGNYIQLKNADESTTIDLYNSGSTGIKRLYANSDIQTSRNLFVANRIYGDTTNNTLYLVPSTTYDPEVNDQYIILDPTAPNHIHVRAGGAIDASTAELYLGGELTNVQVSDVYDEVYIRANNRVSTFGSDGSLSLPGDFFASSIPNVRTGNLVYFDTANGRFSYADDNSLTPTSIANGSFSLSIQSTDGKLVHNGHSIELANGAIIKDTAGDAVAFGQNAGTIGQGSQAVAIGDSAGYNNQGAYGVAIGYGAGNVSQGQVAIAIGLNAGISNQGYNGIAIGGSAGSGQGQYAIAMGYDSGGQQGDNSIAIGNQAGKGNTSAVGINSIVIGNKAGFETATANSIILNASGLDLSSATSGLFINPVRYTAAQDSTYDGLVFYNSSTKEVRYSYALDGGTF